jgi:glyoxylase-like metal-dependent hydrolase (beta-lactamase superfamily II)
MIEPDVQTYFEPKTGTWQYLVADPDTKEAVIIDSVLDFDPATSQLSTDTADKLLAQVKQHGYTITHILETHAHADHLTASRYLQTKLHQQSARRPDICIGQRIADVQQRFGAWYDIDPAELQAAFDHTFSDAEEFPIGNIQASTLHLPGHTPDHIGYIIGSNVFTGDSIFNPDVGSARCDFPGGSAKHLYHSTQKLLDLPPHYRLYTGHDYPPESRAELEAGVKELPFTTVAKQRAENKHVNSGTREEDFIKWRTDRDRFASPPLPTIFSPEISFPIFFRTCQTDFFFFSAHTHSTLSEPRLLHQSLQVNIRGGRLPRPTEAGFRFLKVPLKVPDALLEA